MGTWIKPGTEKFNAACGMTSSTAVPQLQQLTGAFSQPGSIRWRGGLQAGKKDTNRVQLQNRLAWALIPAGFLVRDGNHVTSRRTHWQSPTNCNASANSSNQAVVESAKGPDAGSVVVRGVLFDMDGVLCDSEDRSREAAVEVFAELGVAVAAEDFIPFMGTGQS